MSNSRETLEACLAALYQMEKDNQMSMLDLYKSLFQLAFTWWDDDQAGALRVLAQIPAEYFQGAFAEQTAADQDYAALAIDFWKVLARYGVLTPEPAGVNMPPAKA
jgi:hypothetical protein